jgi:hypothetical protein
MAVDAGVYPIAILCKLAAQQLIQGMNADKLSKPQT